VVVTHPTFLSCLMLVCLLFVNVDRECTTAAADATTTTTSTTAAAAVAVVAATCRLC
jgi:hypothetical protein